MSYSVIWVVSLTDCVITLWLGE